jgi:hypothetical protein
MLEQRALLLLPPGPDARRPIVAADTGAAVGFACWSPPGALPWWRRPWRRVLEVRELEDEPLLFTVRRCWSLLPRREVRDADGWRVGTLLGPRLDDDRGRRLALRCWEAGGRASAFRTRRGELLAWSAEDGDSLRLTFGELVQDEPFVKMLLLGAALCRPDRGWF